MLTVQDDRRSRSKSPAARDHRRDLSADTTRTSNTATSPSRQESRRKEKKEKKKRREGKERRSKYAHSGSESESGSNTIVDAHSGADADAEPNPDDQHARHDRSSKKYHDPYPTDVDGKPRRSNSKRHGNEDARKAEQESGASEDGSGGGGGSRTSRRRHRAADSTSNSTRHHYYYPEHVDPGVNGQVQVRSPKGERGALPPRSGREGRGDGYDDGEGEEEEEEEESNHGRDKGRSSRRSKKEYKPPAVLEASTSASHHPRGPSDNYPPPSMTGQDYEREHSSRRSVYPPTTTTNDTQSAYPENGFAPPPSIQSMPMPVQPPNEARNVTYDRRHHPGEGGAQSREYWPPAPAADPSGATENLRELGYPATAADQALQRYEYQASDPYATGPQIDGGGGHRQSRGEMGQRVAEAAYYNQSAPHGNAEVDLNNVGYANNVGPQARPESSYTTSPPPNPASFPAYTPNLHYSDELKGGQSRREEDGYQGNSRHEDRASKEELRARLDRLTISNGAGPAPGMPNAGGSRQPRSPILESYRGTYQSISPMPSPMSLAKESQRDVDSSEPSDPGLPPKEHRSSRRRDRHARRHSGGSDTVHRKHRPSIASASASVPDIIAATPRTIKRVSFYDPAPDAQKIAAALFGTNHGPSTYPLVSILPSLSTDDMLALRAEYKNHATTSGKGINMAKHIKMRVPGYLGKAAYATALGRWESEAYWANMWYQSGGSRRELLIESLMGRSNSSIREIKNCFRDKRYDDDLEICMNAELKADKFRFAVLLALAEERMSDSAPLDVKLIEQDVRNLYRALRASRERDSEGNSGETAMIQIIVLGSDNHLREVLRAFESSYHLNFAREMISTSRNLVGETLAHILNGALNRPMRDALLLHQAMTETTPGRERAELLISRVIRLHWEPRHMEHVKRVYRDRYHIDVGTALRKEVWKPAALKSSEGGQWVEFLAGCLGVDLELDEDGDEGTSEDEYQDQYRRGHGRGHKANGLPDDDRRKRNDKKSRRGRRSSGESEGERELETHDERRLRRRSGESRREDHDNDKGQRRRR